MAIKKSELYASLWASCDALRGSMDASQYKDYVLVLLFIKYISDKYAGVPYAEVAVPAGASFKDMVALKGNAEIGDLINKRIIGPLASANQLLDMPDFNDPNKLGTGKAMVDTLTELIAIFENPALDFSKNRADGDDILGDAYEYLMRHFATESGKSKGQFYTPAEVSRIMAKILNITDATGQTTVYDPTCGSGSLLLKVAEDTAEQARITLYGQEKDATTSGLARMNMILHNYPTADIKQGNTLADPRFLDPSRNNGLLTFDYIVANPPFSDKRWGAGVQVDNDPFERFSTHGAPPDKQGDYAYLLHIVRSLKSIGKAACILPHGVLFRGNAEGDIRRSLLRHGLIQGIIGLPANLFYGTGIPACIIVIDKRHAAARKGIFMVDASQGYAKDGPKNSLRERDIHRIVDVFVRQDASDPRYARMVGMDEIEQNGYNLNLPRYIDASTPEDAQDIAAHLHGGIPQPDVAALQAYWNVCPQLKTALFAPLRPGYAQLAVPSAQINATIYQHPEYSAFIASMAAHYAQWRSASAVQLKALAQGFKPKALVASWAGSLLAHYQSQPLMDAYAVYQHAMDYWAQTLQDDAYLIAADGWVATVRRVIVVRKEAYTASSTAKSKTATTTTRSVDTGWACDLVPKALLVARYFAAEQAQLDASAAQLAHTSADLSELIEANSSEDQAFHDFGPINAASVKSRLKEIAEQGHSIVLADDPADERAVLTQWQTLAAQETALKKQIKSQDAALDAAALATYPTLTAQQVQVLVVDDKWLTALGSAIHSEMDRISQTLTQRVKQLAARYDTPLPTLTAHAAAQQGVVAQHLARMGFAL